MRFFLIDRSPTVVTAQMDYDVSYVYMYVYMWIA